MSEALAYEPVVDENDDYEIINGKVYKMPRLSLRHNQIVGNLYIKFKDYLRGKKGTAFGRVDVFLSEKDDHVIPDVGIACNPEIITEKRIEGTPDLVVEILSRSTGLKERTVKLFTYAKYGVKEYWLVDPVRKSVEVYLRHDGVLLLDNIYYFYTEKEWADMDDKERAEAESQRMIKVSLYDDFIIDVADVFEDVN